MTTPRPKPRRAAAKRAPKSPQPEPAARPRPAKRSSAKKSSAPAKPAAPPKRARAPQPDARPAAPSALNQKEVAQALGLSTRQVRNLDELGIPRETDDDGRAIYPWPAALRWYVTYREELAARRAAPATIDEARERKLVAEARLAEIEVAKREGVLIPLETHEAVVAALAERLRAVLINAPSQYGLDLERAGVSPADAQTILENIADSLTRALRSTVDDLEDEADLDENPDASDIEGDDGEELQ